jgi:membrane protein DedA with SNARE-associated domain
MKKYISILKGPLIILALVTFISLGWNIFDLPPEGELIPMIKNVFDVYRVPIVFVSAIIESAFVVGLYAPGGLVIFLGVIFSVGDPLRALLVVMSVIIGFMIGFTIDFYLGRYGWYTLFTHFGLRGAIQKTKERIANYGLSVPWVGYHHPDLGSLIATCYGILQYTYKRFVLLSFAPVAAWCIFWGTLAYILGEHALEIMSYKSLLIVLGIWILIRIIEIRMSERKKFLVQNTEQI